MPRERTLKLQVTSHKSFEIIFSKMQSNKLLMVEGFRLIEWFDILLLGLYYGVSICLVSFASAMAVVTLNIHHRGLRGTEVPEVIKKYILNYLSRYHIINKETLIYVT